MADFTMFAGDSKLVTVTVLDEDGLAVNIAGATIKWEVARVADDSAALITKTVGSGIALTTPLSGVFTITLDEADTDDLEGLFYHEAELTLAGDVSTVLTGNIIVVPTLIRAP